MAALRFGCTNLNGKKIGDNDFRSAKINQPKEYVNVAILIFPPFEHFQAYVFYMYLWKYSNLPSWKQCNLLVKWLWRPNEHES